MIDNQNDLLMSRRWQKVAIFRGKENVNMNRGACNDSRRAHCIRDATIPEDKRSFSLECGFSSDD